MSTNELGGSREDADVQKAYQARSCRTGAAKETGWMNEILYAIGMYTDGNMRYSKAWDG